MLSVLEFYVSSFWVWLGITIGLGVIVNGVVKLFVGAAVALGGGTVHFNKED